MSPRWKRGEDGRLYSTRGWGVVNDRINRSRRICEKCGRNTSIYTKRSGRFCYMCRMEERQ